MLSSKEIYCLEHERLTNVLMDAGLDFNEAYQISADEAYERMTDRIADMADEARMRAKEGWGG